ncbi:hypothetical protein CONLIGDRAFT_677016 [Coniochaeta ligniaria NRRL 30616]|uniref:Uncharacterized protein n=1 Tax=Coniochaeta ligniaria NRRL 30616 TaxID=1408157 RepID=A0A1J7JUZ5_9PEZI|nr:hypothetical protein CONLIGDRAFT_677016 [Coniochaeta ligniaria NRRL 30616]
MSSRRPTVDDDVFSGTDAVTYDSRNKRDHSSFTAATPPNSRHAARLAKIAMAVQQPQHEKRQNNSRGGLLSFSQPQQIEYHPEEHHSSQGQASRPNDYPAAVSHQQQQPQQYGAISGQYSGMTGTAAPVTQYTQARAYQNPPGNGYCYQDGPPATTYAPPQSQQTGVNPYHHQPQQVATTAPRPFANVSEVTRLRTEQKTAYNVKSDRGTLRVSAPVGSNEAQLFDAIAEANSVDTRSSEPVSGSGGWLNRLGW